MLVTRENAPGFDRGLKGREELAESEVTERGMGLGTWGRGQSVNKLLSPPLFSPSYLPSSTREHAHRLECLSV